MKNWWISWNHETRYPSFELHSPWWISGSGPGHETVCAAISAPTEMDAKLRVVAAYDPAPSGVYLRAHQIHWRFCHERPNDWSPFSERFPQAKWMQWPNPIHAIASLYEEELDASGPDGEARPEDGGN